MRLSYWKDSDGDGLVHIVIVRWQGTVCQSMRVLPQDLAMDDGLTPTCLMCIGSVGMYERIIERE